MTTTRLFDGATLVVPTSQVDEYRASAKGYGALVEIPDDVRGTGPVKNWVLANFQEEIIVILDDDIRKCVSLMGEHSRTLTKQETRQMVYATAVCAADAGATIFGWNQAWDVRKINRSDPFRLNTWVSCALGVVGRAITWDDRLLCKSDIDRCLESLLKDRIVWQDARFSFMQERDTNRGGNAELRTAERISTEVDYIRAKWGKYVSYGHTKRRDKLSVKVPRRQHLDL